MKKQILVFILLFAVFATSYAKKSEPQLIVDAISHTIKDHSVEYFNVTATEENQKGEVLLKGSTTSAEVKQQLIKKMHASYKQVVDSVQLLPLTSLTKPWAIASVSIANLRNQPDYDQEMVSQALMGTPMQVLQTTRQWALVRTPDKLISWVNRSTVAELTEEEYKEWKNSDRVISITNNGIILDANNRPISNFVRGNILALSGPQFNENPDSIAYLKIKLPNGVEGRVKQTDFISFTTFKESIDSFNADRAIAFGETLLGRPYLWGGLSPFGMDCSGFVRTVTQEQGLLLARNSSQQARYGQAVDIRDYHNLKKGDLLFFRSSPTREGKVTHVGMSMGNGLCINCAGRVKIDSFDPKDKLYNENLTKRLIGARRITGKENNWGITTFAQHPWY